jgi:uncharacterized protein YndB with AHSA1/START domain
MKTKTLQQTVTFKASPRQVYDMLMDSKRHRRYRVSARKTAARLAENSRPGARTSQDLIWRLSLARKIVQAWRATGWWSDHYSVVICDIAKTRDGTRLKFTQIARISPSLASNRPRSIPCSDRCSDWVGCRPER